MRLDFSKGGGLLPAIIQDEKTDVVLMLGYMNEEALARTREEGRVTFFSRSKERLWTKGETSGNFLEVVSIKEDCDQDTLLIRVRPKGPVCHTGADTCFGEENRSRHFLDHLAKVIESRKGKEASSSYTASLFQKGIQKIAQKVGEEAVELILEAESGSDERLLNESADLIYHLKVLLSARELSLKDVEGLLRERHGL
jgi:phosphoribosyl-ATP pyrophosphohydrolase/phosphoribosyl-AMP cyclohydrolase